MYAETELLYPYLQCFTQEVQPFDEFYEIEKSDVSMCNLVPTCTVSDYDLGGEGDLFKAPEPIIEEQVIGVDPMTTVSMIPDASSSQDLGGEGDLFKAPEPIIVEQVIGVDPMTTVSMIPDASSFQPVKALEVELIQGEQLLNDVFYKSERDFIATSGIEEPISKIQDEKPPIKLLEDPISEKDMFFSQGAIQKSVSSGCLNSMEWIHQCVLRPNFLEFQKAHFRAADGIRRAYSEGDIQTLSNGNINLVCSSTDRAINTEGRLEKLSRYRKKKTRRNFGRTIKYACRKALADNQPRVRGRFAKTEESDVSKK